MRLCLLFLVALCAACVSLPVHSAVSSVTSCDSAVSRSEECTATFESSDSVASDAEQILAEEDLIVTRDMEECTIPRINAAEFTSRRFLRDYYQRAPFILVNYSRNQQFRAAASVESLLAAYGNEWITTASANTFSHTKTRVRFSSYVDLIRRHPLTLANESSAVKYFFGDHDDPNQFAEEEEGNAEEDWAKQEAETRRKIAACIASNTSSVDDCTDDATSAANPKGPIWAKLLRKYSPPPYVLPQTIEAELAAEAAAKRTRSATEDSPAGEGNRHAVDADAARILFDSASAAPVLAPADALPPLFDYIRYSFGVGSHRSGVPFHFHGAAIGEVLVGRKRWWLFPPKAESAEDAQKGFRFGSDSSLPFPSFRPELTQLQWLAHIYPTVPLAERPLHCLLSPGQLLYVPGNWHHATTNLGEVSVFISSFVDEGRMEGVFRSRGIDVDKIRQEAETETD